VYKLIKRFIVLILIAIIISEIASLTILFIAKNKDIFPHKSSGKTELIAFVNRSLKPKYKINNLGEFKPSIKNKSLYNYQTSVNGNAARIGYSVSANGVFKDKYVVIEEDGFRNNNLETVIKVFDKYFVMPS